MGLLDGMNAALSNTPATPAAPVAPVAAPAPEGKRYRILPAGECVEGRPYRRKGQSETLTFDARTPTAIFFSDAAGAPVRTLMTDLVEDLAAPLRGASIKDIEPAIGAVGVVPPDAAMPSENAASVLAAPAAAAPAAPVDVAEESPKPRGRPKGSKNSKAEGDNSIDISGLVLCVNCHPSKPATDLTSLVCDIARGLAEAGKVEDVRFTSKDHPFSYSAWRGAMAKKALDNVPTGLCVIYSSDLADPVIEALAGVATMVIRG